MPRSLEQARQRNVRSPEGEESEKDGDNRSGDAEKDRNLLGVNYKSLVERAELFSILSGKLPNKIETVIHMGACADTTMRDMNYLMKWNVDYSRELCEWSLRHGARFIYASSAAVYGRGELGFSDDDNLTPKLKPLNAYGKSKWLFDKMVLDQGWESRVAGLRFFNVFGPNEYHKGRMASVVFHAYPQVKNTGKVKLFESHRPDYKHGEQCRDFIHIEEVLAGTLFVLDHSDANGIFNLGTGKAHTYNQLAENVCKALNKPVNIEYFPMPEDIRDKYQYQTVADMSKFNSVGIPEFPDRYAEYVQDYVRNYLDKDMKTLSL